MEESKFRLIYRKHESDTFLGPMDVVEISYNGISLDGVTDVKFHASSDGLPALTLSLLIDSIEISGPVDVEIVTEQ